MKHKKWMILFVILLILLWILFGGVRIQNWILKKLYPLTYQETIEIHAKEKKVDSLLVFSIIKAESNFQKNVVSRSNAIGLMQLLPETAEEIAQKEEIDDYIAKESLYNAEINIQIGIAYFSSLLNMYNNCVPIALAAYNAGIGNVNRWIKEGIIQSDGSDIENIPFKETNNYVRKILRDYEIYQKLYS